MGIGALIALLATGVGAVLSTTGKVVDFIKEAYSFFHSVGGHLLVVIIVALLWIIYFEPIALPLLRIIQFINAQFFYRLISQEMAEFMFDTAVTLSTVKLIFWVIAPHVPHVLDTTPPPETYGNYILPVGTTAGVGGFTDRTLR